MKYVVDGPPDGEVVVLSGSLGSDLRMWDPQIEPLTSAGFRVVRYDHRGHGGSPVPQGPYSLAELAGDLLELLDSLEVRRAHLVGLSLGGMVGMWLGRHAPDRLNRLVLCATSAKLLTPEDWEDRARLVRAEGTVAVADSVVGRWLTDGYRAANPERTAELRAMVESTPAEGYASCCGAIGAMDLTPDLASITAPTLAIFGQQDPATPPDHGQRIADAIPKARLEVLDPGAHLVNVEQAARVSELIVEHLSAKE
ncbi:MAG: 3-oxoadipate enol-lactonase [Pseudonocardiaceae bacterium]|nr:3-oxoadipate enol-lactonase [Pseudonocardiaceae bacterium]